MELESLPEGWELKRMTELCEKITSGGTPLTSKTEYYNGDIPWAITEDITSSDMYIKQTKKKITKKGINNSSAKLFPKGTLLLTMYGTVGKVAITEVEMATNQAILGLIPKKQVDTLYLYYFLKSFENKWQNFMRTTTQSNINATIVKRLLVPIPPLEEQKKIVEILQFADYLKERRKEAIKLIDKIVMSLFYDMFGDPATNPKGWEVKKIGNIIEDIKSGFAYGKFNKERGIPQLRPYNITEDGKLDLSTLKYVPDTKKNIEGYYLKTGDIIFNNTNSPELVGKTTIFKSDLDCVFSNHLTRIRLDETKATPAYIKQLFNYLWLKRVFQNRCHQWVNQASINNKNLRELEILLPPLDLQQEFTEIVSKLEDKRKQMEEAEEKLEMLYQILLKQAFTGKLTEEWRWHQKF